ncbi:FAD-dependent oxidoreductase [Mycobacterium sp. 4D054]|uniref:FAD-dependent oxidoreductase n=1 Tax=Mycobacterium sp. 4D054 TaxID=3457440 RepID=UPI003FD1AC9F
MAYVITQNCCKDASCVPVCPVDCIRPTGGAALAGAEMLYIDPEACIDCGACMEECPVGAIDYVDDLPPSQARFADINAAYFEQHQEGADGPWVEQQHSPVATGALRVAIVGAGPAACYAAADLIAVDGVEISMFERLPTPFGLIRAGVAPDHQATKAVVGLFDRALASTRAQCYFNVEVGQQISHDELLEHHHAVIYAVGASSGRTLDIPGADMTGSHAAADFVGWYNGHPDHADHQFDLGSSRAVILGNGNVALDMARVLLADRQQLAATDIADHALNAVAQSGIEEVVIIGRRGPRDAAFSVGEFLALAHLDGVDVAIDCAPSSLDPSDGDDMITKTKLQLCREYAETPNHPGNKTIVFRFHSTPLEVLGSGHAEGVRVSRDGVTDDLAAGLVLHSIGYSGRPIPNLPFDAATATVPNDGGRVVDDAGAPLPGVYVTGWIKRGPRGVIGSNRMCAAETVAALLADFNAGVLPDTPRPERTALDSLMAERGAEPVDWQGWKRIDRAERVRGERYTRPRNKFLAVKEMTDAAAERM